MSPAARFGTVLALLGAVALLGCEHDGAGDGGVRTDASRPDAAALDAGRRCARPCTMEGAMTCDYGRGGGYSCDPCRWNPTLDCAPGELCEEWFWDGPCGPRPYIDSGVLDASDLGPGSSLDASDLDAPSDDAGATD